MSHSCEAVDDATWHVRTRSTEEMLQSRVGTSWEHPLAHSSAR